MYNIVHEDKKHFNNINKDANSSEDTHNTLPVDILKAKTVNQTVLTNNFNNFKWKRLPLEHDYISIIFCIDNYNPNNIDNSNNTFNVNNANVDKMTIEDVIKNINTDTQKAIKYILNIMPYQCVLNLNNYNIFLQYIKNDTISPIITDIENNEDIKKEEKNILIKKISKFNNKKTFIQLFNSFENNSNDVNNIDKSINNIYNITINNHFNEIHRLCIGDLDNIPKSVLSVADFVFFENKETLNKYLKSMNHNVIIQNSKTQQGSLYLLDKCNHENYQLYNFNKHI